MPMARPASPCSRERVAVEAGGGRGRRAGNVEQDGAAAAAIDRADIGADQDQQRLARRQGDGQRRHQRDAHGGGEPRQRADDEADERGDQRIEDRGRRHEARERADEKPISPSNIGALRAAGPGRGPGTAKWMARPADQAEDDGEHGAPQRGCRRGGVRRNWKTKTMTAIKIAAASQNGRPWPTRPMREAQHTARARRSAASDPTIRNGGKRTFASAPARKSADHENGRHQRDRSAQQPGHQAGRRIDRRLDRRSRRSICQAPIMMAIASASQSRSRDSRSAKRRRLLVVHGRALKGRPLLTERPSMSVVQERGMPTVSGATFDLPPSCNSQAVGLDRGHRRLERSVAGGPGRIRAPFAAA